MTATTLLLRGQTPEGGVPGRDPESLSRVVRRVDVTSVELVQADFERYDDLLAPVDIVTEAVPDIALNVDWALHRVDDVTGALLCLITFATVFADDPPPYFIGARLRLTYSLDNPAEATEQELEQFCHHNAMFNAWPYWREFVSSIVNRGQLPRFVVPVMRMPS